MIRGCYKIGICCMILAQSVLYGQSISRHILALYDSGRSQTPTQNHVHANAEVILNHLGLVVDYWDIQDGLPGDQSMRQYRGVLTWFYENEMKNPEGYLTWASRQVDAGKRFVILGSIGAFKDKGTGVLLPPQKINKFAGKVGFAVGNSFTTDTRKVELVTKIPQMVEFERSLDHEFSNYGKYTLTRPGVKPYLVVRRQDQDNSESALVFTTANGGFAAAGYILYENPENFNKEWRLNPFRFFEEAFGLQGLPRPDVTTLNGMRIWCSHIDGDALISKSRVKPNTFCGEIIRDEILKKYEWPVSVSVIVSEVLRGEHFAEVARSIFKLDWVEAASHSYSHPFYWAKDFPDKDKYPYQHLPLPGYTFNIRSEVEESVRYIDKNLLPHGKKVKNFFWTGNCEPTPEAVKLCEKIGVNNINGGDTIFDKSNPSYTSVAPIGADVGGYRQIYAPNANENIYTNEWHGPYYGFKFVTQTFDNTESPVRIKPIDIYYHFYSGERWAALNALKKVIDESTIQDVAPIFISEYTQIALGFYKAAFERLSENTWKATDYGACRTIRFDNEPRFPDLDSSENVLGFRHYQGSLYIHLGPRDEASITLTDKKQTRAYLKLASHRVKKWLAYPDRVAFEADGFGKGDFTIANVVRNHKFKIIMVGRNTSTFDVESNPDGTLRFLHAMRGPTAVTLTALN